MKFDIFDIFFVKSWYIWLIFFGVIVIKLLLKIYKPVIKGAVGETVFGLTSSLSFGKDYHIMKNIVVPAYDGTTQIDQIIISKFGIFVIEIKTYKGWIFGSERDSKWTQSLFKEKHAFQNPLLQNYKHIKSLQELTKISKEKFKSVILFSGEVTFKTPMPSNVTKGTAYIDYIKSFKEVILTEDEVEHIVGIISDSRLSNADHREYIKNRSEPSHFSVQSGISDEKGYCIRCKAEIKLNITKPYCLTCFEVWNKYSNKNYHESCCHICGQKNSSSMNKPVCYDCYKQRK